MYLWYVRLGHINLKIFDRLVKEGHLSCLTIQPLPSFASCLEEKMTKFLLQMALDPKVY